VMVQVRPSGPGDGEQVRVVFDAITALESH
jgi:hypothetical protein